jgi:hypothetical protein
VPEYEDCCRVSEANDSQTSYAVEQADIFQCQSYSGTSLPTLVNQTFNENGDCVCNKKKQCISPLKGKIFQSLHLYKSVKMNGIFANYLWTMFVDISDTTVPNLIYV